MSDKKLLNVTKLLMGAFGFGFAVMVSKSNYKTFKKLIDMKHLTRFRTAHPILQHDPFRNLESFFNDFFSEEGEKSRVIRPAANIYEDKNGKFCIELSAPGFDKKDIDIELNGHLLTVSARKEESKEDDNQKSYHKEFSSYEMERSFTLGEDMDVESLNAKYENGVLSIYIDRSEEKADDGIKKIEIQ